MNGYQLNIPTKVYFGRDIWREAIKSWDSLFYGNVLIVTTGCSLNRLGYVQELERVIKECVLVRHLVTFDSISANPKLSEVKDGITMGKAEGIDVVVGFGGGSAIDAAKAIALGIGTDRNIEDFFDYGIEAKGEALPVIAIPTTAGTGSELSKAAILTKEHQNIKRGIRGTALYPKAAIVDSVFTESVPYKITMETGFDVLAHGIESYISRAASPYTRMQSEYAVGIVGKYLSILSEDLHNIKARQKMSYASMIMGINLGNASTCLPHRMQYPLGAYTNTSHGNGIAALFTSWISMEYSYVPEKVEKMLGLLTRKRICGGDECAGEMYQFIKKLGLPTGLKELGVDSSLLKVMAEAVEGNLKNDPAIEGSDREILLKLYEEAWQ